MLLYPYTTSLCQMIYNSKIDSVTKAYWPLAVEVLIQWQKRNVSRNMADTSIYFKHIL